MKKIRESSENEMILCFLKSEIVSSRFGNILNKIIEKNNIDKNIILNGNLNLEEENKLRKTLLNLFRGYPDKLLFNNFPLNVKWEYFVIEENDIYNFMYINFDYWNELSNNTSNPLEAAKNIKNNIEIYGVSNKSYIEGSNLLEIKKFPPVILLTCDYEKYLIIEGHSRITTYALKPEKIVGTYAYVGVCSKEEMIKYYSR